MAGNRRKVVTPPAFKSWGDVDAAFREIIECEGCIDEITVELNRTVSEAKAAADQRTKPIREKVQLLEAQIRQFTDGHRDEISGKTQKLNFGSTGYRLSTKLVIPRGKEPDVIGALRRHKMIDCITVKESVNKDTLKRYKSEDILRVGAYLKSDDEFWYEVDKEQLRSADSIE